MKTDEQRIAIAEAVMGKPERTQQAEALYWLRDGRWLKVPDYLNDLNAMAEAEKSIKDDESVYAEYEDALFNNGGVGATARQRAEAFLRTIGRWTDGESEEKK